MKKRSDSDETDVYRILIDGVRVSHELENTELLKIDINGDKCVFSKTKSWEYYQFLMEA